MEASVRAARTVAKIAGELADAVGWNVTARCNDKLGVHDAVDLPERLPTREEAALAATILLRCNGHDLDVWTLATSPETPNGCGPSLTPPL
jgi:hypothetical protein